MINFDETLILQINLKTYTLSDHMIGMTRNACLMKRGVLDFVTDLELPGELHLCSPQYQL